MQKILRLIDANLNRTLEGLRVSEDIARFVMDNRKLSRAFKSLRHRVTAQGKKIRVKNGSVLKARNVKGDVGKKTLFGEKRRKNVSDIYRANIQRVKESLRVLEEITKLFNGALSGGFKKIRFRVYQLEKKGLSNS